MARHVFGAATPAESFGNFLTPQKSTLQLFPLMINGLSHHRQMVPPALYQLAQASS